MIQPFLCSLSLAALLTLTTFADAQCRGGRCSGGSCGGSGCPGGFCPAPTIISVAPSYEWVRFPDDDSQVALFCNGVQVGGFSFSREKYQAYLGAGRWGEAADPPVKPPAIPAKFIHRAALVQCPCGPRCDCGQGEQCRCCKDRQFQACQERDGKLNFGMGWKPPAEEKWTYSGRPVDRETALKRIEEVGSAGIPDDGGLAYLNVTGSVAERQAVMMDLVGKLAPLAAKFRVHAYDPQNKMVLERQWPNTGHPTITVHASRGMPIWTKDAKSQYVQTAALGGEIVHQQDDYQGGADALAAVLQACAADSAPDLRRPDKPIPIPIPIPIPTPPVEPETVDYTSHACCAMIVGIIGLAGYLIRSGKK
jgi:hypothetical protein